MQINRENFNKVITFKHQASMTTAELAQYFDISERQVQRIMEAGTWERWPYIQAKIKHGYNTPEYKTYLKRRGLPLTPPSKVPYMQGAGHNVNITSDELLDDTTHDGSHWYRLKRWFGWGK